jgi:putative glutamine amidotransferase
MKKGKPVIGVTCFYNPDEDNQKNGDYLSYVQLAGGIPFLIPHLFDSEEEVEILLSRLDGLLLSGGYDINPFLYNEDVIKNMEGDEVCKNICERRDICEARLVSVALRLDIPLFGICRGFQLVNVVYGGSLYQDLPIQFKRDDSLSSSPTRIIHRQSNPGHHVTHRIDIMEKSPLFDLYKTNSIAVNSFHHQGVKVLGSNLTIMARATGFIILFVYFVSECRWANRSFL